jgi:beta-phosphoglucomutase-like phosphatase (HAD superfamily)
MHDEQPGDRALRAVLWDMDGTLVDTEPYWFAAETELLADVGRPWTLAQAESLIGNALPDTARILQAEGVDLGVREIIDRLVESVVRQVREAVPWRPGARELLVELSAAGVPCALVTMSEGPLAHEVLRRLPDGAFRIRVTGDMDVLGKPAPDPYLLAARLLAEDLGLGSAFAMERVVAIEDSVPGVTSALAAGAVTVGVPNQVPLPDLPGLIAWDSLAGRTVADLEALVARVPAGRR